MIELAKKEKYEPVYLVQSALIHVEVIYDCHLLLESVRDDLEAIAEEHQLEGCKLLRRSRALLEHISGTLENCTDEMRWQLSEALKVLSDELEVLE